MENNNDVVQPTQGVASKYKTMFENLSNKKPKRQSREEILAKYFVPRANKEYFRILPPAKGKDFLETAFFHAVPVNAAGGQKRYRKIYCPAHNDGKIPKLDGKGEIIRDKQEKAVMVTKPCPLCDKSKAILAKQDPSIRKIKKDDMTPQQLAIKESNDKIWKAFSDMQAKKFYIIKGIDKGAEKDGVKFWRFKHNFKQQGVLDKLGPAITNWMEINEIDFTDKDKGTDLILTVVDQEMPGRNRTYRDVSSIYPKGSSPLHADSLVEKEWLEDNTTWRDVFKAASAPNIEPIDFLEMVVNGQSPYWDDSDTNNKHWVFPGNPELEKMANTRDADLDADKKEENIEMASDVVSTSYDNVNITNVKEEDVGTFEDNAVDLTAEIKKETVDIAVDTTVETTVETSVEENEPNLDDVEDYDDLPF